MKYRHFKKSRKNVTDPLLLCRISTRRLSAVWRVHRRHLESRWGGTYLWRWRAGQHHSRWFAIPPKEGEAG